ncbi:MAG: ABC transporter ATP-binding protein [Bdellovibrionales bacterium]|nr:ABC transporter ATP-binding protein [Bdellovibrionales bacterium]
MIDLYVNQLRKSFSKGWRDRTTVLNDVNFGVEGGKITGFLGANGAGKTTTIKCLFNLINRDSGQIDFFGKGEFTPEVAKSVGFLPERPYFYDHLTGREFLSFYGNLSKKWKSRDLNDRIVSLLKKVDLTAAADRPLRSYSKGMLQRIGISQAILNHPKLVVLDEPMAGLDPDGRFKLSGIIKEIAQSGTTVFFSSHLLHDVEVLCENLVILKDGGVAFQGKTNEFLGGLVSGFELVIRKAEVVEVRRLIDIQSAQSALHSSMKDGYSIESLKPIRPSLEEAFVRLSSKGDL